MFLLNVLDIVYNSNYCSSNDLPSLPRPPVSSPEEWDPRDEACWKLTAMELSKVEPRCNPVQPDNEEPVERQVLCEYVSEDVARDMACFGMTPVGCKKSKLLLISFSVPATNLVSQITSMHWLEIHVRHAWNKAHVLLQVVQELRQRRLPAIEVGSLILEWSSTLRQDNQLCTPKSALRNRWEAKWWIV